MEYCASVAAPSEASCRLKLCRFHAEWLTSEADLLYNMQS